ncbi:MAG: hypothetical protein JXB06_15150 [Spirochaetales bacterium]|nr:hypothetical protein [Spirochaetales bacterium]
MIDDLRAVSDPPRLRGRAGILIVFGVALCLTGLFAGLELPAQSAQSAPGVQAAIVRKGLILAMNHPLDSEAERLFQGVASQTVRWALERRMLVVIEATTPPGEAASLHDPIDLPDGTAAEEVDFILLTEYASRGRELEIRMAWYDPRSGEITEEVIRRGRKDLVLDKILREALSELLSAVESSLEALEPREFEIPADSAAAVNAGFKPGTAGIGGQTGGGSASGSDSASGSQPRIGGVEPPLPAPTAPAAPAPERPAAASPRERQRHFDIGLGCAPFVATGTASEYFKLGVMPVMSLSYLFQRDISRFGVGLYGGLNVFTATGELDSAETFLIPMGVCLRYEIGSERYPAVVFALASGPALLMMSESTGDTLRGITVFGRGSLGVRLPVGRVFALLIEAGYDVYWEQPQPIMGFSPAVYTTVRL